MSNSQALNYLYFQDTSGGFRNFPLDKPVILIGRSPGNDIIINHEMISNQHARLVQQGPQWVIEDLGSSYGVYVNGYRITTPVYLKAGDQVSIAPGIFLGMQAEQPQGYTKAGGPASAKKKTPGWLIPVLVGAMAFVLIGLVAGALVAGYFYLLPKPAVANLELPANTSLDVSIQEPAPDTHIKVGDSVLVRAEARDESGITRIELWINDVLVSQQDSPEEGGITPFRLEHGIQATQTGTYLLTSRAYNGQGQSKSSMAVNVVVEEDTGEAARKIPASKYVAKAGETLDDVARKSGAKKEDLKKANPNLPDKLPPGGIIMIPALPAGMAKFEPQAVPGGFIAVNKVGQQGGQAGGQAGGQQGGGKPANPNLPTMLNPNQVDPNLIPDPMTVFNPPKSSIQPPELNWTDTGKCKVNLVWTDKSKIPIQEMILERVSVPSSLSGAQKFSVPSTTTGYQDTVPVPGVYLYTLHGCAVLEGEKKCVPSNTIQVEVLKSDQCWDSPQGFKFIYFQPLIYSSFNSVGDLALWYSVGNSIERRLPEEQGIYKPEGDWSYIGIEAVPAPSSIYLNPEDPLQVELKGAAYIYKGAFSGEGITDLGSASDSHPLSEILGKTQQFWRVENEDMRVDYRVWIEDVKWTGKGTSSSIPAPTRLRISNTSAAARVLEWDWPYEDKAKIDGYILYRNYLCPGEKLKSSAPVVIGVKEKKATINLKNEPANCFYQYMVSAFGRSGESAPSNMLSDQTTGSIYRVQITAKDLTISDLSGSVREKILLSSNNQSRETEPYLLEENVTYDLENLQFGGAINRNSWAQDLAETEFLQIGLVVSSYEADGSRLEGGVCTGGLILPPVSKWEKPEGTYTLSTKGGVCKVTVQVKSLGQVPSDARFIPDQPAQPPSSQGDPVQPPQKPEEPNQAGAVPPVDQMKPGEQKQLKPPVSVEMPDVPPSGQKMPRNPDSYYFKPQNKDDTTAGQFYDLSVSNADITQKIYGILEALKLFTVDMNTIEANIKTMKVGGIPYVEGCQVILNLPNFPRDTWQVDCYKQEIALGMDTDLVHFLVSSEQIKDPTMKQYVQSFLNRCRVYVAHYLVNDGGSNDKFEDGMKTIKEREEILSDLFSRYNNTIRALALISPQ